MHKLLLPLIFVLASYIVSAQNNDLIVTTDGDSIACEILEVSDSEITFKMKYDNRNTQTMINLDKIAEFQYDVIQKGMYLYKPKTSYIIRKIYPVSRNTFSLNNLQNASGDELDFYLEKAEKNLKTGKTLVTVSTISIGAATLYAIIDPFNHELGALVPAGIVVFTIVPLIAVGMPMQIVNKKRVKRINTIKNTAFNDVRINIQPCAQYNLATQNYQPGIVLNITF